MILRPRKRVLVEMRNALTRRGTGGRARGTMGGARGVSSEECVANFTRSKKRPLFGEDSVTDNRNDNGSINGRARKRRKVVGKVHDKDPIWVSATHTRNYMLRDPIVDWFKLQCRVGTRSTPAYRESIGFTGFIMECGNKFESKLVEYIHLNRIPVVSVIPDGGDPHTFLTEAKYKETFELMKAGTPLIHSAPIRNPLNNTRGIIDLLIRSDYLGKLVDENPLTEEEIKIPAKKLGKNYHYLVIDIKFSTLPLRSDGKGLLNSGHIPAYKAQTLIYNEAIGLLQGYTPRYTFLLGRRWRYTSKDVEYRNYTCLNRLGVIDYYGYDKEYLERTKKAIEWVRDVKENGDKWITNPPSREELYPNMCVDSGVWNKEKEKIAEKIGEITNVWYCGIKNRKTAISKGITSWKDSGCTAEKLGIGGKRGSVIDKILDINRQNRDLVRPDRIKSNVNGWKCGKGEMFVDFESFTDVFTDFSNLPKQEGMGMIFMIGVGWEDGGEFRYKSFICRDKTYKEEFRIMNAFTRFVKEKRATRLRYWHAEKSFWNRAENRQFEMALERKDDECVEMIAEGWKGIRWMWSDLCEVFRGGKSCDEPIVIKGCFKFGLKAVAKALRSHGLISTKIESDCESGLAAMVRAWRCYSESEDREESEGGSGGDGSGVVNPLNPLDSDVMKDIEKYNEFDCKVLWDILRYLRKNHM